MIRLAEFEPRTSWFFNLPEPPTPADLVPRKGSPEQSLEALQATSELFKSDLPFQAEAIREALDGMLTEKQWKKPLLFMPLRFALTSRSDSPDLIEVMMVLGRNSLIDRIERAIAILECSA
jgi:glutamyl-tRNA synthetase